MIVLPQEIQDIILLYLDSSTLVNCRDIQSEYIKSVTLYNNLSDAANNENLNVLKWIKDQGCPWGMFF